MKIAIVHDWITGLRGGERCLQAFLALYPNADLYTLIHVKGSTTASIDARVKRSSFLNKFPFVRHYYRALLPLFPWAARSFNFQGYDLIISLSHAAAKNVVVPKGCKHICYCFTPMRYIWDQAARYLGGLTKVFWPYMLYLRAWDKRGSNSVDVFVAISRFVSARIRKYYGRRSYVVYPAIDDKWLVNSQSLVRPNKREKIFRKKDQEFESRPFLYAGALVQYKQVDAIIEAFNQLGFPLVIVGRGPLEKELKRNARKNISFQGHVSDEALAQIYESARALIFPVKEEFGLVPVECMARGTPVIALYAGAAKETVIGFKPWGVVNKEKEVKYGEALFNLATDNTSDVPHVAQAETGVFINVRKGELVENIMQSVRYFINVEQDICADCCHNQANQFSLDAFYSAWTNIPEVRGTGVVSLKIFKNNLRT